jgi:hypothetical protein
MAGLHADARLTTEHLRELGIGSVKEARQIWTNLGRTAQLPWLLPEVQEMHPYIDPLSIILMPPAHNLLRGLTSKIVSFIVKTSDRDLRKLGLSPIRHPLVLSSSQQSFVKVQNFLIAPWTKQNPDSTCDSTVACIVAFVLNSGYC